MHERKRKMAEHNSCHQREKMRAAMNTYQHARMDACSEKCLCNPPRSHDDDVKPALSLSLSLSLSLFCLYSEAPPCADLRIDGRVFVSAAACPISVILLLAFWSILWKNDERDYLESKLIIDALFCFVDRFLYAIRTHAGSGSEIFSSGF
jgi:hypothetical protein